MLFFRSMGLNSSFLLLKSKKIKKIVDKYQIYVILRTVKNLGSSKERLRAKRMLNGPSGIFVSIIISGGHSKWTSTGNPTQSKLRWRFRASMWRRPTRLQWPSSRTILQLKPSRIFRALALRTWRKAWTVEPSQVLEIKPHGTTRKSFRLLLSRRKLFS